ncbi:MAG: DUF1330 domain-containing protein [Steroidobacteraceae bacterium]|jgi:uncharacterized protein (DUF1330 family)
MKRKNLSTALIACLMLGAGGVTLLRATAAMPKGYVVAEITVTDAEAYKNYVAAVVPVIAKFGGKYLVRGGQTFSIEGAPPSGRIVVLEFDSLAAAKTFEDSPDYAVVAQIRHKAAQSRVFLVEGAAP